MKKWLLSFIVILAAGIGVWLLWPSSGQEKVERSDSSVNTMQPQPPQEEFDKTRYSLNEADSIWLVVNKQRPLPPGYVPEGLRDVDVAKFPGKPLSELQLRGVAAAAAEDMFAAAGEDGINLLLGSGYRSYDVQEFYYNNYVDTYGQAEADKFSARPGTSEHQTGLALDVSTESRQCYLEVCFADTAAGEWVAANARDFGFIIRYPKGKRAVTGYQYEPWHLRYVGGDLAVELHEAMQTMEEFFGL